MSSVYLRNSVDFDFDIKEKFIYSFYHKNETIKNDNKIDNSKVNPSAYIQLDIKSNNRYDLNILNYYNKVNIEKIKNISGKNLSEQDLLYFNFLNPKSDYILSSNLDKKRKELTKENLIFQVPNEKYTLCNRFLTSNKKININKNYLKNVVHNSKSYNFDNSMKEKIKIQENLSEISVDQLNINNENISLDLNFIPFSRNSSYNFNSFYYLNIGYLVEKYCIEEDKKILKSSSFFYNKEIEKINRASSNLFIENNVTIKDNSVRYGKEYFYIVYPTYVVSIPTKLDYHFVDNFIVCDSPYITNKIECKEFARPLPPNSIRFKFNKKTNCLDLTWKKPENPQGDTKGYQIFKRNSLEEPYKLLKQIEFYSENDFYTRNKNIVSADVHDTKGQEINFYSDMEFNQNKIQMYAICSLDAHGYSSNYSTQIAVMYDFYEKKCITDLISESGAPLHMPNVFIKRKTKFFDNDDYITTNLPFEEKVKKFTLYATPEYFGVLDGEKIERVLEDKYKFNIYKLETGENFVDDINIKNFSKN